MNPRSRHRSNDDPLIDEVRAVRKALADEFDDDVDRLCEHLETLDEQYHSRICRPPEPVEAAVESIQRYHMTLFETCAQSVQHLLEWDADPRGTRAERRNRFDALVGYFRDEGGWRRAASHGSLPAEVLGYPIEAVCRHVLKLAHAREVARQIAQLAARVQKLSGEPITPEAADFVKKDFRALRDAAIQLRDACPLQGVPIVDPATWKRYFGDPLTRGLEALEARTRQ
jgi:hypothetical protein